MHGSYVEWSTYAADASDASDAPDGVHSVVGYVSDNSRCESLANLASFQFNSLTDLEILEIQRNDIITYMQNTFFLFVESVRGIE